MSRGGWRTRGEREEMGTGRKFRQRLGDLANRDITGRKVATARRRPRPAIYQEMNRRERLARATEGPIGRIITAALLLEVAWLLLRAL